MHEVEIVKQQGPQNHVVAIVVDGKPLWIVDGAPISMATGTNSMAAVTFTIRAENVSFRTEDEAGIERLANELPSAPRRSGGVSK